MGDTIKETGRMENNMELVIITPKTVKLDKDTGKRE